MGAGKVDEQEVGTLTLIRQDQVTVVVNFMDRVGVIVVELSTLCRLFSFFHCSVIVCCKVINFETTSQIVIISDF